MPTEKRFNRLQSNVIHGLCVYVYVLDFLFGYCILAQFLFTAYSSDIQQQIFHSTDTGMIISHIAYRLVSAELSRTTLPLVSVRRPCNVY